MPPARAGSQTPAVAGRGAATPEVRDVRVTGPRNEFDISQGEAASIRNEYPRRKDIGRVPLISTYR